jgi:hypothetical protein
MEHTIFGLIKKRSELAGHHKVAMQAADALKADVDAIDRALVLCGYQDDPKPVYWTGDAQESEHSSVRKNRHTVPSCFARWLQSAAGTADPEKRQNDEKARASSSAQSKAVASGM